MERGVRSLKEVLDKIEGPINTELVERLQFQINNHVSLGQGSTAMRYFDVHQDQISQIQ